jgi:hypothetical protein
LLLPVLQIRASMPFEVAREMRPMLKDLQAQARQHWLENERLDGLWGTLDEQLDALAQGGKRLADTLEVRSVLMCVLAIILRRDVFHVLP